MGHRFKGEIHIKPRALTNWFLGISLIFIKYIISPYINWSGLKRYSPHPETEETTFRQPQSKYSSLNPFLIYG